LVKESWLLLTNSYGFLAHPYLTLTRLRRDRSQIAIFFSLWSGTWLAMVLFFGIIYFLTPRFLPEFPRLRIFGLGMLGIGTIFLTLFTLYLFYWLMIWQKRKKIYGS